MDVDPHVEQASKRLGTVLSGKYTVERILGVGGMAVVYAATHRNQKQVAIKMLHRDIAMHPEVRKRFLREGYVANSVKHRGAVDVIDDDVDTDGATFLVMEYLDGAPVDAMADKRGGRLDPAGAVVIVHELCGVLAAAHARDIVHRDIKPANLFVTTDGVLKVLDFGIARLRDSPSVQATGTGMTLGTPAFMAPEQARGQTAEVGPASDIWAAGVTLFNLLSGQNVHDADNAQMMMIKVATTPPRSLSEVMPSIPRAIIDVVDKATQFDRKERWESAGAMRAALREAFATSWGDLSAERTLTTVLTGAPPAEPERPVSSRRSDVGSASTVVDATVPLPAAAPPAPAPAAALVPPIAPARAVGHTTAPVTASFVGPIASKKLVGVGVTVLAVVGAAALVFALRSPKDDAPAAAGNALVATAAPLSSPASAVAAAAAPAAPSPAPVTVMQPLDAGEQPLAAARAVPAAARSSARGDRQPAPPRAGVPAVGPPPVPAAPPVASPAAPPPAASPPRTSDPGAIR